VEQEPTEVLARLWALLAAVMRSPEAGRDAPMNPALICAAASASRAAAMRMAVLQPGQQPVAERRLAYALLDACRLLGAKDRLHFSPSLEHRHGPAPVLLCATQHPFKPSHSLRLLRMYIKVGKHYVPCQGQV
jgi:hypothetical protein